LAHEHGIVAAGDSVIESASLAIHNAPILVCRAVRAACVRPLSARGPVAGPLLRPNLDVSGHDRRERSHDDRRISELAQRIADERELVAALGGRVVGNRRDPVGGRTLALAVVLDPKTPMRPGTMSAGFDDFVIVPPAMARLPASNFRQSTRM